MKRQFVFSLLFTAGVCILSLIAFFGLTALSSGNGVAAAPDKITQGALRILRRDGIAESQCPLKHTDVKTEVSGGLARSTVTQEFNNPLDEKIEAVYIFPLPADAAVDDLTMLVGERTIKGKIKRREEARQIYEAARNAGQLASLLDQERPNIFTQSVANIAPGATVKITISYVETLKYEDGAYELVFPMVVGPRYIPGKPISHPNPNVAPNVEAMPDVEMNSGQVPDASRITPPITPEGTRAGHDISIEVRIDAGVPIDSIKAKSHAVDVERPNAHTAIVGLKDQQTIPNRDFVLRFNVAGKQISDAVLAHRTGKDGFFTLMLQPPERVAVADVMPKEIVFVLDTSGSMSGFPVEKAKEAMRLALDGMNPHDTFNLITFAGDTHILFLRPVPATRENLQLAQAFLAGRRGGGGTEMMKAIRAALGSTTIDGGAQDPVRIVCFMTDGYVGDDFEIIGEVQKHPNARVFSFGIGESVNRFLLDRMATEGRGEVEYVSLTDDGSAAARRFHERVQNPLLTDINIDWGGLPVADVYPKRIPDLFSAKPLVLTGRYSAGARGTIRVSGRMAGRLITREIPIALPDTETGHDVLSTLWARAKVADLMSHDFAGLQSNQAGQMKPDVKEAIIALGLEHRLMTQFTSFVAVEERVTTEGGKPRRVDVPVEMPKGVSYDGIAGTVQFERLEMAAKLQRPPQMTTRSYSMATGGVGAGIGGGVPAGVAGGATNSEVLTPMPPPPPKPAPTPATKKLYISDRMLYDGAINRVQPRRPAELKTWADGFVRVRIGIDVNGDVVEAEAMSGHPLLRGPALDAARQWKFKPMENLNNLIVRGTLNFYFKPDGTVVSDPGALPKPNNLYPAIAAVIERIKTGRPAGAGEAKFIKDHKAKLTIELGDKTEWAMGQLNRLGFEIISNPKSSLIITGRLPIEKLAALAELSDVKSIAPLR